MRNLIVILLLIAFNKAYSQDKNFIDQPYLETTASVDTSVVPDKIYLSILISEKDTKGKISVEELESQMIKKLNSIGLNTEKQLSLSDLSSTFKKYFLQQKDVIKNKLYQLIVYDAQTAGKVIVSLEELGISNVDLEKVEYSRLEELKLELRSRAIIKAKKQGEAMANPLNQKLGLALYISDNLRSDGDYVMYGARVKKEIMMYNDGSSSLGSDKSVIEFEKINVEVEVSVKFKIE